MRILVLGGTGFIDPIIVRFLHEPGPVRQSRPVRTATGVVSCRLMDAGKPGVFDFCCLPE